MDILTHPLFIVAILLCIAGEYVWSRKKGLNNFDKHEAISNLVLIGLEKAMSYASGDGKGILAWLTDHRLITWDLPSPYKMVLTLVLVEFLYYCNHWYHHNVSLGWASHIMHHSPAKYNFTLAYRLGVTRMLSLGWVVFLPAIFLGFDPDQMVLSLAVIFLIQFFLHTELVPTLGPLDYIFNTPTNHRVHHSGRPSEFNKNLGGVTLIFDHLFGTFQKFDKTKEYTYGIPEVMAPKNIWFEITYHWRKVLKDFRQASGVTGRLKALFGPPA